MTDRRKNSDVLLDCVPVDGKTIIDVGCGDGSLARLMAAKGAWAVVGMDVTDRQLAKAMAAEPVRGVVYLKAGGEAMPFPDASADAVVFFNSLHHLPDDLMSQALAEAARVVKPGGLVYVGEPVAEGPHFEVMRPIDDETRVRALALAAIRGAGACGLEQVQELTYIHTVRRDSFEQLKGHIGDIDPTRDAKLAEKEAEVRALFEAKGTRREDGTWIFDQPMRVNLLRKAG